MLKFSSRSGTVIENTGGPPRLKTGRKHTLELIVVVLGGSRKENEQPSPVLWKLSTPRIIFLAFNVASNELE